MQLSQQSEQLKRLAVKDSTDLDTFFEVVGVILTGTIASTSFSAKQVTQNWEKTYASSKESLQMLRQITLPKSGGLDANDPYSASLALLIEHIELRNEMIGAYVAGQSLAAGQIKAIGLLLVVTWISIKTGLNDTLNHVMSVVQDNLSSQLSRFDDEFVESTLNYLRGTTVNPKTLATHIVQDAGSESYVEKFGLRLETMIDEMPTHKLTP